MSFSDLGFQEIITELEWRPEDTKAMHCQCCGDKPSLFELTREGVVTKMVNCNRAELRPNCNDAPIAESCPMYTPGLAFNKPTRKAAIKYWNMIQDTLRTLRENSLKT